MKYFAVAALAASLGAGFTLPASAQNLRDVGRALQDQVLGNPGRDQEAYQRGREDQARNEQIRREEWRREREARGWDERRGEQRYEADRYRQRREWERAEREREYAPRY